MTTTDATRFCFLLCSERSGSNLIASMMGQHSKIYAPPPLHLVELLWSRSYLFGDLAQERNWTRLLRQVVRATGDRLGFEVSVESLKATADRRSIGSVYRHLYGEGMRRAGCSMVFLKENEAYRHLGLLLTEFGDARFLCQVRDPRDVLLSHVKLRRSPRKGSYFGGLRIWHEQQEHLANAVCTLPASKIRCQRYEDLLSDPERTLRTACEFLGVEFEPAMLEFDRSEPVKDYSKKHASVENVGRPLMTQNTRKYRREFSRGDTLLVELKLHHLMEFFEYERDHPKIGAGDVVRLVVAAIWRAFRDCFRAGNIKRARLRLKRFRRAVRDLRRGDPQRRSIDRRFL